MLLALLAVAAVPALVLLIVLCARRQAPVARTARASMDLAELVHSIKASSYNSFGVNANRDLPRTSSTLPVCTTSFS